MIDSKFPQLYFSREDKVFLFCSHFPRFLSLYERELQLQEKNRGSSALPIHTMLFFALLLHKYRLSNCDIRSMSLKADKSHKDRQPLYITPNPGEQRQFLFLL